MILFYGEGRLGNQVFQYQALNRLAKKGERIAAVGLEELQSVLDLRGPALTVLTLNGVLKRLVKFGILPLLRVLARDVRLLNYCTETRDLVPSRPGPSGEMSRKPGLLRSITLVDGGWYQNSCFWEALFPVSTFRLNDRLSDKARETMAPYCAGGRPPVFVHVRRGDYLTHAEYGLTGFTLPLEYYFHAIREIRARVANCVPIFVTDDPDWVRQNFQQVADKVIVSSDVETDFAIMTQCTGGVLSNSTFSLAAALMLLRPAVVVAPEHWMGFRVARWYPPKIRFEHPALIYIPVSV